MFFGGCLGCVGHTRKFDQYIEKQWWGTSFSYFLNRDQLQELLNCFVKENRLICNFCQNCYICGRLYEIRERLDSLPTILLEGFFVLILW